MGAEFIAACTCLEAVEGLQFKLRMFGIPVEGPTDVMCDNNSVVNNLQHPESVLSKKHLSCCATTTGCDVSVQTRCNT